MTTSRKQQPTPSSSSLSPPSSPQPMLDRHPLSQAKKPGPRSKKESTDVGDEVLDLAGQVLDAVASGRIQPLRPSKQGSWKTEIGKLGKSLTVEQETLLAHHVHTFGDVEARNVLVTKNIGLVRIMIPKSVTGSMHEPDFFQEGILGLLRATETFSPSRGLRFSTYASFWIKAKMNRFRDNQRKHDEPNSNDGVSDIFLIDEDGRKIRRRNHVVRLDDFAYLGAGTEGVTVGENLINGAYSPEEEIICAEVVENVRDVLDGILFEMSSSVENKHVDDSRTKDKTSRTGAQRIALLESVVRDRLLSHVPQTLSEIGKPLSYSREGVRLTESVIIRKARKRLAARGLGHPLPEDVEDAGEDT